MLIRYIWIDTAIEGEKIFDDLNSAFIWAERNNVILIEAKTIDQKVLQ